MGCVEHFLHVGLGADHRNNRMSARFRKNSDHKNQDHSGPHNGPDQPAWTEGYHA
jgi:hypothetical protein